MNNIEIYTDTACFHNGKDDCIVSVGVYIPVMKYYYSSVIKDTKISTVNRGELYAILTAMKIAYYMLLDNIIIYSDSSYAVNIVNGTWGIRNLKNVDIIEEILEYQKKLNTCIMWVKGHEENTGNNVADALAVIKLHDKIGDRYKLLKKYKKFKEVFCLQ